MVEVFVVGLYDLIEDCLCGCLSLGVLGFIFWCGDGVFLFLCGECVFEVFECGVDVWWGIVVFVYCEFGVVDVVGGDECVGVWCWGVSLMGVFEKFFDFIWVVVEMWFVGVGKGGVYGCYCIWVFWGVS